MCMQCMANADFMLTTGILGAASARIGLRHRWPRGASRMSDEEATAILAADSDAEAPRAQVSADG